MISAFDLFKIGIGPSSSHTMGPMAAAKRFRDSLDGRVAHVTVELFGSLAWTGHGHGSDKAVALGLLNQCPRSVDPDIAEELTQTLAEERLFRLDDGKSIVFDPANDLRFNLDERLPLHPNGMRFCAFSANDVQLFEKIYYSVGGGFIVEAGEAAAQGTVAVPYPFKTSAELLAMCHRADKSIADIQLANELALRPRSKVNTGLDAIFNAMLSCIERGLRTEGKLPGGLKVNRRAKALYEALLAGRQANHSSPHVVMDWVSTYAIAVNEENAAGGRVVTAPTNGAAGIVPAVLRYYLDFCSEGAVEGVHTYLLTAAAIGGLIKCNASISGAEVGCQGEVGTAAAMAAAGLAAVLGGRPPQVENAAEIAMEHHLGMTCDPIGGLVQIPCIERNAFGANKAIAAASLALRGNGIHRVSLDEVIETMRQTGMDMQLKYKETSQGGLAVTVAKC